MEGVTAGGEDSPCLWRDDTSGKLMMRVWAEGGMTYTDVELWGLVQWLQTGPGAGLVQFDENKCG